MLTVYFNKEFLKFKSKQMWNFTILISKNITMASFKSHTRRRTIPNQISLYYTLYNTTLSM